MNRLFFFTLALGTALAGLIPARGDEETCAACDRQILVTGQFQHGRGHESLAITGAPKRQAMHHIASLERSPRGVRLTEAGAAFLTEAQALLQPKSQMAGFMRSFVASQAFKGDADDD